MSHCMCARMAACAKECILPAAAAAGARVGHGPPPGLLCSWSSSH